MAIEYLRLGLISDTHGLSREEAILALQESDLIIHADDVGAPGIVDALKAVAPVVVVRWNIDTDPGAEQWPETEMVETERATIYVSARPPQTRSGSRNVGNSNCGERPLAPAVMLKPEWRSVYKPRQRRTAAIEFTHLH